MILKETLQEIVKSQRNQLFDSGDTVPRRIMDKMELETDHAVIISGIRRCGKSTLLKQIINNLSDYHYFNFEDIRATGFEVNDFNRLDEVFKENNNECPNYFFDEVQNVDNWERFIRTLLDQKKHVYITGSNASLLSRELGTKLTGRHIRYELFPFSYKEMLRLTTKKAGIDSFEEFFIYGGFPEYLRRKNTIILQELFNDIIMRDIIVRQGIRNAKTVKELALYLLSNVGKEYSYTNLKKNFQLGSVNTVISFVSYLEDSYLFFSVPKFEYSYRKQLVNPKKIYAIDNGLINCNTVSLSDDKGRLLENSVFIELKRHGKNIFYYRGKNECDFIIEEKRKITEAYQVCYRLKEDNKSREINGLMEVMNETKLAGGFILTMNQEDQFEIDGKTIKVIPAWKWMNE
ncbi:MAG: ATP-binding protein [Melioribacteraceae bacterium]|nr:MAG: ATP-binding protein [Melioribacteraceae bacterium]